MIDENRLCLIDELCQQMTHASDQAARAGLAVQIKREVRLQMVAANQAAFRQPARSAFQD
jgi:Flp pilus assembly protein TadG